MTSNHIFSEQTYMFVYIYALELGNVYENNKFQQL